MGGDDIDKARSVLDEAIAGWQPSRMTQPFVAVSELADSSVNPAVRLWVNAGDYWGVHFDTIRNGEEALRCRRHQHSFRRWTCIRTRVDLADRAFVLTFVGVRLPVGLNAPPSGA